MQRGIDMNKDRLNSIFKKCIDNFEMIDAMCDGFYMYQRGLWLQ